MGQDGGSWQSASIPVSEETPWWFSQGSLGRESGVLNSSYKQLGLKKANLISMHCCCNYACKPADNYRAGRLSAGKEITGCSSYPRSPRGLGEGAAGCLAGTPPGCGHVPKHRPAAASTGRGTGDRNLKLDLSLALLCAGELQGARPQADIGAPHPCVGAGLQCPPQLVPAKGPGVWVGAGHCRVVLEEEQQQQLEGFNPQGCVLAPCNQDECWHSEDSWAAPGFQGVG